MIALLFLTSVSFISLAANVTVKTSDQALKRKVPAVTYTNAKKGTPITLTGEHVVQKGETLFGIAKYYEINFQDLADYNKIPLTSGVNIGQKLKIPSNVNKGSAKTNKETPANANSQQNKNNGKHSAKVDKLKIHNVAQGETLFGIARMYSVNPLDLATENNVDLSYMLKVGQKLKIPSNAEEIQKNKKPEINITKPTNVVINVPKKNADQGKDLHCKLNFLWPTHSRTIATKFGSAIKSGTTIDGIIIATEKANNVFASYGGTVAYAGTDISEYGKLMIIKHTDNWLTIYGYMDSFEKAVGQTVKAGEIIGKSGQSGDASEPSIYFSIRQTKKPYNPEVCL
jgi:murein DD-endopeptidase MepM/ murein hydrolase activator NlpD